METGIEDKHRSKQIIQIHVYACINIPDKWSTFNKTPQFQIVSIIEKDHQKYEIHMTKKLI